MQPLPEVSELHRAAIVEYLVSEPDYLAYDGRTAATAYVASDPITVRDGQGLPGNAPPWGFPARARPGQRRCSTGGCRSATTRGTPSWGFGAENAGGPLLTASGLLFVAATPDGKFSACDAADGTLLWQADLDAAGYATPITYSTGGRQYVVIAAGGGLLGPPVRVHLRRFQPT